MNQSDRTNIEAAVTRVRMRTFGRKCLAAALPLAALVTAIAIAASGGGSTATLTATSTSNTISIKDSRLGAAILTAGSMKPGDSVQGDVKITNSGSRASIRLSESHLTDQLGVFGGALSGRIQLTVQDLAHPAAPVYQGPLSSLPQVALGSFAPGEARNYRFTATLPNAGPAPSPTTGDNLYQGSRMSVEFDWTATGPGTTKVLTVTAANPQRVGKAVVVSARCNLACKARIAGSVSIAGSKRTYSLPTANVSLAARVTTKVSLKFSKTARTAIAAALVHHKKVTATVTGALLPGGSPHKLAVTLTKS